MNTRMRRSQRGLNSASLNDEWAFVWSKLSIHFSQASQRSEDDGRAIVNLQTSVHQRAQLAQSVEHETLNLRVVGSSPTLGANSYLLFKRYFFWIQLNNWENEIRHVILWQQPSNWTFFNVGLQSMQITWLLMQRNRPIFQTIDLRTRLLRIKPPTLYLFPRASYWGLLFEAEFLCINIGVLVKYSQLVPPRLRIQ